MHSTTKYASIINLELWRHRADFVKMLNYILIGDAVEKMEDLVQNKLSDLDDVATNLEFGEDDDEPDSPKRKQISMAIDPKKQKIDAQNLTDAEPNTQDLAEQLDSETTESDFESDYDY